MEERLLLDGIALHAAHISPGHVQSAAAVVANLADSGLPFRDGTAMAAGEAAKPIAVELFVKLAFACVLVDDIAEGGHRENLWLLF